MATAGGFWSYVHADDSAEGERISQLAKDVVAQFQMITGDSIDLFLDKDALEWGDRWQSKIDTSLATAAFFIPIITPRYMQSAECRRELQYFARQAKELGVEGLLLPLLYTEIPEIHQDEPADDLVALIQEFQWEDWREIRFLSVDSQGYREGVYRLAQRLVEANKSAEQSDLGVQSSEAPSTIEPRDEDEESGSLDRMASLEVAMPNWSNTIEEINTETTKIAAIMKQGTARIKEQDERGKGFAGRVIAAREISQELQQPSESILSLGNRFASDLHAIDDGIRAVIEAASDSVEDAESLVTICEFFQSIRTLSEKLQDGLQALSEMLKAIQPIERMSRDLRPPLRTIRHGLTLMYEGRGVTDEWLRLMDNSGIDCTPA